MKIIDQILLNGYLVNNKLFRRKYKIPYWGYNKIDIDYLLDK